jgi:hypothetical protein
VGSTTLLTGVGHHPQRMVQPTVLVVSWIWGLHERGASCGGGMEAGPGDGGCGSVGEAAA